MCDINYPHTYRSGIARSEDDIKRVHDALENGHYDELFSILNSVELELINSPLPSCSLEDQEEGDGGDQEEKTENEGENSKGDIVDIDLPIPDGYTGDTLLHRAAQLGVDRDVVVALVEQGAWRSLRNVQGKTPLDCARTHGHKHLYSVLTLPREYTYEARYGKDVVRQVEENLHRVILGRVRDLIVQSGQQLPQIEVLAELGGRLANAKSRHYDSSDDEDTEERIVGDGGSFWYPVPGMYGGFSISIPGLDAFERAKAKGIDIPIQDENGNETLMIASSSWSRVCGGSEQEHLITKDHRLLMVDGWE